jgi:hypothetical protein
VEAEYRVVANAVAECVWLQQLLHELGIYNDKVTIVYCDNVSACLHGKQSSSSQKNQAY